MIVVNETTTRSRPRRPLNKYRLPKDTTQSKHVKIKVKYGHGQNTILSITQLLKDTGILGFFSVE